MTQSHSATIGFVGLGRMGGQMAANLVTAGYRVQGYDVVEDACQAAAHSGVEIVPGLAEAARGASIVITMLPNGALFHECYEGDTGRSRRPSGCRCSSTARRSIRSMRGRCMSSSRAASCARSMRRAPAAWSARRPAR